MLGFAQGAGHSLFYAARAARSQVLLLYMYVYLRCSRCALTDHGTLITPYYGKRLFFTLIALRAHRIYNFGICTMVHFGKTDIHVDINVKLPLMLTST